MLREPSEVTRYLHRMVRSGYRPMYSFDSACDYWANWLVLSKAEFDSIVRHALDELKGSEKAGQATLQSQA